MGSDIYGVFQKQTLPGVWNKIDTKYKFLRHYLLFNFIGDVLNEEGALGHVGGPAIDAPLAKRGLPDDLKEFDNQDGKYRVHSFITPYHGLYSWFFVNEYLSALSVAPAAVRTCVISKEDYAAWLTWPVRDSGLRDHPDCRIYNVDRLKDAVVINDDSFEIQNTPGYTHVRVKYEIDLKEEFEYFTDEINRLIRVHGTDQIRFVYGFCNV